MITLSSVIFAQKDYSTEETIGKKSCDNFLNNSSSSMLIHDLKEENEIQETIYLDLLRKCVGYENNMMRLSLVWQIIQINYDVIQEKTRCKLINIFI